MNLNERVCRLSFKCVAILLDIDHCVRCISYSRRFGTSCDWWSLYLQILNVFIFDALVCPLPCLRSWSSTVQFSLNQTASVCLFVCLFPFYIHLWKHSVYLRNILAVCLHKIHRNDFLLGFPCRLFPRSFPTKILCAFNVKRALCHHSMSHPRIPDGEDCLPIRKPVANILTKQ